MEKLKTIAKMICYILGLLGMFCLFITYVSAMNLGYIKGEFLTTFLLLFVFISFLCGAYFFIYLLHGQITYLEYLQSNKVVIVKRKGIKYLGNLKNSDLVVSIFKSGQVKFLDVVPIDVITDMSKMMDKMVLKAHV